MDVVAMSDTIAITTQDSFIQGVAAEINAKAETA